MKSIIILALSVILITNATVTKVQAQANLKGQITLSGAFALYPMAVKWADEFKKLYPNVKIDISAGGAGKGMTDALSGMVDIGMVSREVYTEEIAKGAFPVAVTKDAVVAIVSASNPALNDILAKGLKQQEATDIWITGKNKTWADAFDTKVKAPLHVYTRSDACGAADIWAKFQGKKQEDLLGSGVFGDPGLALAVKKDPLGIGFNNIGYAYDSKTKRPIAGIKVIPLDINNNGKIDADENFYNTLDEIVNAIATGKYPSPPARELFFVIKGKPAKPVLVEFIKFVLTKGQKYVNEAGYIQLSQQKLEGELNKVK